MADLHDLPEAPWWSVLIVGFCATLFSSKPKSERSVFTDDDILEMDADLAVADFRSGTVSETMTYDILREIGLSNSEIARRLYAAKAA